MPLLPSTSTQIGMQRAEKGFTNNQSATNVRIGAVLNPRISRPTNVQTGFSQTFGGRTVPYTY